MHADAAARPGMIPQVFGPNVCVSGGADGADLMWGMVAGSAGHNVVHWSFPGHRSEAPACEVVQLSVAQLAEADPACLRANHTLKRTFPPRSIATANLLRRNWYQVRDASAVYAVAEIDENGTVTGGTAWAVQMFIDRHDGAACRCYVFCQRVNHWFEWQGAAGWVSIYEPPIPSGVWAGIGTRKLSLMGKLAIRVLLDWRGMRNRATV